MGCYRLHIDIPLHITEDEAIRHGQRIMDIFCRGLDSESYKPTIEEVNYRLGHDDDRQKSNYFDKNQNGHVSNKKTKILLKPKNQNDDGLTAVDDVV
jgi:hypothetical protein